MTKTQKIKKRRENWRGVELLGLWQAAGTALN
jgi:hypothetical protein